MERSELITSKEYWIEKIKLDLYQVVQVYKEKNGLTLEALAQKLGVTKGYLSQVLNGNFDHKISKLVELALACDMVPLIKYEPTDQYVQDDELDLCDGDYKDRPIIQISLSSFQTKSIDPSQKTLTNAVY
ncbi:helix-turn-helix domain-containing protein [Chitinophaga sp.]|uniref:helix-turn-helix domain-containing protein n=1 Tax=Chitinophaga sp. TaxID=1869181 RepID=UPI0031E27254